MSQTSGVSLRLKAPKAFSLMGPTLGTASQKADPDLRLSTSMSADVVEFGSVLPPTTRMSE